MEVRGYGQRFVTLSAGGVNVSDVTHVHMDVWTKEASVFNVVVTGLPCRELYHHRGAMAQTGYSVGNVRFSGN